MMSYFVNCHIIGLGLLSKQNLRNLENIFAVKLNEIMLVTAFNLEPDKIEGYNELPRQNFCTIVYIICYEYINMDEVR